LASAGHNYQRYVIGDAPPDGELRHSTLDTDDGRNGLGTYGGLSFILESGIRRRAEDPNADLGIRIDAYLHVFGEFIHNTKYRDRDIEIIENSRRESRLPSFIPRNFFWANVGQKITEVKVIEKTTGETQQIPTANFMQHRIVKSSVPTPRAYAVEAASGPVFRALLDNHAIPYRVLEASTEVTAEPCLLESVSETYDEIYNRYSGLQVVRRQDVREIVLPTGTLLVPLEGRAALRAALLLEPTMLYGLYQFARFRQLADESGVLPVLRVIER
jgi:hypothetical protein